MIHSLQFPPCRDVAMVVVSSDGSNLSAVMMTWELLPSGNLRDNEEFTISPL